MATMRFNHMELTFGEGELTETLRLADEACAPGAQCGLDALLSLVPVIRSTGIAGRTLLACFTRSVPLPSPSSRSVTSTSAARIVSSSIAS